MNPQGNPGKDAVPLIWDGLSVPGESMDDLHRILTAMTADIRDVLDSAGIPFYLVGGSAIGVMRDGRQVPWDDDIDILVDSGLYPDAERALYEGLSGKYTVELSNTSGNHRSYCRVVREDTTLIRSPRIKCALGITVEVFPMVDIPDGGLSRKLFFASMRAYNMLNIGGDYVPGFLRPVLLGTKKTIRMVMDKLSEVCTCTQSGPLNALFFDEIVDRDVFGTPSRMVLDGEEFPFPGDNDRYLRQVYGDDYLELPPEGSRKAAFMILDTEHGWKENMDRAWELFSKIRSR